MTSDDQNYFKIRSQDEETARKNLVPDNSSKGLTTLPESVLSYHGALMLDPATAARVDGYVATQPTAYRAAELLLPADSPVEDINNVLGLDLGLMLEGVSGLRHRLVPDKDPERRAQRREKGTASAVRVDAWTAMQTLRSATLEGDNRLAAHKSAIDAISLNHLLIGSAMGGIGGVSVLNGVPGAIGGNPDPGKDPGNLGYWRIPVAVQFPATRRSVSSSRRPVIAVLDTGIGKNSWLGVVDENDLGPFVHIDQDIQKVVHSPVSDGLLDDSVDHPPTGEPLTGYLSSHTGHGTFIMGIVHQVEPDADVLSIRVMHNDGVVYEDVLHDALAALLARVTQAQDRWKTASAEDKPEWAGRMVDVVSLSLGGYQEEGELGAGYDKITRRIQDLHARGVVVVASAGNYASSRPFMPAALAKRDEDTPVVSVGARNPNGTKALFANDGLWVTTWALGAGVVSTFPENTDGSGSPSYQVVAPNAVDELGTRESLEVDDFRSGYAIWAGTSFAAPAVAAQIARLLKDDDLSDIGPAATLDRARAAVKTVLQM